MVNHVCLPSRGIRQMIIECVLRCLYCDQAERQMNEGILFAACDYVISFDKHLCTKRPDRKQEQLVPHNQGLKRI